MHLEHLSKSQNFFKKKSSVHAQNVTQVRHARFFSEYPQRKDNKIVRSVVVSLTEANLCHFISSANR